MRILLVHNRYQLAGGEDVVVEAERRLLLAHGHEVDLLEADNAEVAGAIARAGAALHATYSLPGRSRAGRAIQRFKPHVMHVHNFFPQFSPSIYDAARAAGVAVVQTVHNYRMVCPSATLFRDGAVCEQCLGKTLPWPGLTQACYRDSWAQSGVVGAMIAYHAQRRTWQRKVDAFVAFTAFQKHKLVTAGLPADRIHVKPHFTPDPGGPPATVPGAYVLFVGRLSPEKGLDVLLDSYLKHHLTVPLKVIGEGPMREAYVRRVADAGLSGVIEFLGRQEPPEIRRRMGEARFLVFPSIWYETFGLTMIEAFACGRPVLASRLGGIPEIVEEGCVGWLTEPGDPAAWATAIAAAWADVDGAQRRGVSARRRYEERYSPEASYTSLHAIYREALLASPSRGKPRLGPLAVTEEGAITS